MRDLHMHTIYSDGKNVAEDMILTAIEKGLDCVGISDHSHAAYDECAMTPEGNRSAEEKIRGPDPGALRAGTGLLFRRHAGV